MKIRDLILQIKAGDRVAAQELVKQYQDRLWKICKYMLPNKEDAHEVLQEVFITIITKIDQLNDEEKLTSWIQNICRNHCFDRMRQVKSKSRSNVEIETLPETDIPTVRSSLEKVLLVQEVLSQFESDDRWLIVAHFIQGLSYDEISEVLGQEPGALRTRMSRIKTELLKKLK